MNKNRKIFIIMPIVLLLFCCALVPCFLLCKNSNGIISTNSAKNDNGKIDVKLCTYEDVSYEDNTLFVKSQLLIAADAEYSYSDIEKIISKYNGKIVGYIEFTNDYQIEFDKMDYDTLNKTAELLKTSLDKSNITLNLAYYQDNDTDKVPINKFEKKIRMVIGGVMQLNLLILRKIIIHIRRLKSGFLILYLIRKIRILAMQ